MDRCEVEESLLDYHLGTLVEEERDQVEAHLLQCTRCLAIYLGIKRTADARSRERPSDEARGRLRAEVERTFAGPGGAARRSFPGLERGRSAPLFSRRIPLYQGLVAAAVAAAVALIAPRLMHAAATERSLRSVESRRAIDTSRPEAESLRIY